MKEGPSSTRRSFDLCCSARNAGARMSLRSRLRRCQRCQRVYPRPGAAVSQHAPNPSWRQQEGCFCREENTVPVLTGAESHKRPPGELEQVEAHREPERGRRHRAHGERADGAPFPRAPAFPIAPHVAPGARSMMCGVHRRCPINQRHEHRATDLVSQFGTPLTGLPQRVNAKEIRLFFAAWWIGTNTHKPLCRGPAPATPRPP